MWRTTAQETPKSDCLLYFNPRPPCGGRRGQTMRLTSPQSFQSTSPVWRTTARIVNISPALFISIHVPRVEDDTIINIVEDAGAYFNPRPPCGGRPRKPKKSLSHGTFQSTSPVWRTTADYCMACSSRTISIHVPRVEDDDSRAGICYQVLYFNPRPPCGGRPLCMILWQNSILFQSTSPVWRTTKTAINSPSPPHYFNPRPPCGGRQKSTVDATGNCSFQSTSPVWRTTAQICDGNTFVLVSIHVPRVEDDRK